MISIWVLPFNILKHEVSINKGIGYVIGEVGIFKEFVYLRALEGSIIEINAHEGKLVQVIKSVNNWNCARVDNCTGWLLGTTKENKLEKMVKDKKEWVKEGSFRIDTQKSEVKSLSLIDSEKASIFLLNGMVLPWIYQS